MSILTLKRRASSKPQKGKNAFFFKGYSPLGSDALSVDDLRNYSRPAISGLFIREICMRGFDFAFSFPFCCLYAGYAIARATIFNLVFILGGFKSDNIFYSTGKYNQLATKSVLFLLFSASAFLLEGLYLLVGLFVPSLVLNSLGEKLDFTQSKVEHLDRGELYEGQYLYYVYCIGAFLQRCKLISMSMVVMSLLCEPVDSIVHGMRMLFCPRDFKLYGANPNKLTYSQKIHEPLLFLHGAGHDESAFTQLLCDFRKKFPEKPLFTLKLPEVAVFEGEEYAFQEDVRQAVIQDKITKIQSLYDNNNIEPIIIGHSAGADAAVIRKNRSQKTGKAITQRYILLGANARSEIKNEKDLYITARNDEILCLESERQQFADIRNKKVRMQEYFTGHLGLLTHPKVINDCTEEVVYNSHYV